MDAHPDINTDQTTVSGNIHGMPVSALLGLGEPKLANLLKAQPKLKPENIVMLGTRSIDPPEAEIIKELNIRNYTYDDVLRMGLSQCLAEIVDYMSPLDHVHFSFDVDSMIRIGCPAFLFLWHPASMRMMSLRFSTFLRNSFPSFPWILWNSMPPMM